MHREGHAGLSFLLFPPFAVLLGSIGVDVTNILITCILMVALSSIPDIDLRFEMKHRGILFAVLFEASVFPSRAKVNAVTLHLGDFQHSAAHPLHVSLYLIHQVV